jgi:hypothetical protein
MNRQKWTFSNNLLFIALYLYNFKGDSSNRCKRDPVTTDIFIQSIVLQGRNNLRQVAESISYKDV